MKISLLFDVCCLLYEPLNDEVNSSLGEAMGNTFVMVTDEFDEANAIKFNPVIDDAMRQVNLMMLLLVLLLPRRETVHSSARSRQELVDDES